MNGWTSWSWRLCHDRAQDLLRQIHRVDALRSQVRSDLRRQCHPAGDGRTRQSRHQGVQVQGRRRGKLERGGGFMSRPNIASKSYQAITIWLEPAEHLRLKRALKMLAVTQDRTLKDLVTEALRDLLAKYG